MNLLGLFSRKPREPLPHVIPRYHAATKAENREALARRTDVQLQLAVYNATTTREQREADFNAYVSKARASIRKAGER